MANFCFALLILMKYMIVPLDQARRSLPYFSFLKWEISIQGFHKWGRIKDKKKTISIKIIERLLNIYKSTRKIMKEYSSRLFYLNVSLNRKL